MSHSQPVSEADTPGTTPSVADPRKNPSYPQRVHIGERAHWQTVLQMVETRIAVPRQKLGVLGNDAKKPAFDRVFAQMLGARDQIADAVKRLPQETGDLYQEDHHRVNEAFAALDRLFHKWDALTTTR